MRGSDVVTKLSKMEIDRIAICFNPADQDANIVVVKSVENDEAAPLADVTKTVEEVVEELTKDVVADPLLEKETEVIKEPEALISKEVQEYITKAIADGIQAAIQKTPVMAHNRQEEFLNPENTEGKEEIQKELPDLILLDIVMPKVNG